MNTDDPTPCATLLRSTADFRVRAARVESDRQNEEVTPDDLAAELGVTGRTVRKHMRNQFPRTEAEKGQRWDLTPDQADAVRQSVQRGHRTDYPPLSAAEIQQIRRAIEAAKWVPTAAEMRRATEASKWLPTADDMRRATKAAIPSPSASEIRRALAAVTKAPTPDEVRRTIARATRSPTPAEIRKTLATIYKPPTPDEIRKLVAGYKAPTPTEIQEIRSIFATSFKLPTAKEVAQQIKWLSESNSVQLVEAFDEALPDSVTAAARQLSDAELDEALSDSPYAPLPKSLALSGLPKSAKWQVFSWYLVWMYCLLWWASKNAPDHVNGLTILTGLIAEKLRRELWPKQND